MVVRCRQVQLSWIVPPLAAPGRTVATGRRPALPHCPARSPPRNRGGERAGRRREAERAGHDPPPSDDHELTGALALLDGLPARQRAALTLRYVHDLPDAAIARALRCRPGTVRSLLSRGREAVRAGMQHELQEPS